MDKIPQDPNRRANKLASDTELPYWVRSAAQTALLGDCVEAARSFQVCALVFTERADRLLGHQSPRMPGFGITDAGWDELHRLRVAAGEIAPEGA